MPFVIKFIVRRELIAKLTDDWFRANCPTFFALVCAECIQAMGGMAGEW
ncbi:hypothetical protein [Collimonas pratensis]|nr:hypothetical protein [Collimonas pratensis]